MKKIFLFYMSTLFIICSTGYAELVDNGDGTITDTKTGLMWQKDESEVKNWEAALTYCENLELPIGGYSDWRLPARNELLSIVDYERKFPSIDRAVFLDAISSFYWSSTTNARYSGYAWGVNFADGLEHSYDKAFRFYVRAVRGGQ